MPPSLYVRAHLTAGHPDALGDLTIVELAALRLEGPGEPAPEKQLLAMIRRMQAQVGIGQLILIERVTRLPAKPIPLTYIYEVELSDHHRVNPFFQGESRFVPHVQTSGPASPREAVAIEFLPDNVEEVVTRQAARALYAFDSKNWSDAALTWCNAEKHLSLQMPTDHADADTTETQASTADTQLPFKILRAKVKGNFDLKRLNSIIKNRDDENRPQPYAAAFNKDGKTINLPDFRTIGIGRGEWTDDWKPEESGSSLEQAMTKIVRVK